MNDAPEKTIKTSTSVVFSSDESIANVLMIKKRRKIRD